MIFLNLGFCIYNSKEMWKIVVQTIVVQNLKAPTKKSVLKTHLNFLVNALCSKIHKERSLMKKIIASRQQVLANVNCLETQESETFSKVSLNPIWKTGL